MCTWTISIPSATGIHITFTHFELQAVNLLGQCVDYMEFFDAAGSLKGLIMLDSIVNDESFHWFYSQLHFPIVILHCLLV